MTQGKGSGKGTGEIAIVGMAVNLPGAASLDDFWRNLAGGVESISRLDPAALKAAGESPVILRRAEYVPAAGLLDGYDMFDAAFFGFSPREAAILDPQHRKFLECAWEALENAAHMPADFEGRVGVFAGCSAGSYLYRNLLTNPDLVEDLGPFQLRNTGNDKDFLATRVSHALDLTGPSITLQTACSTALVGVHQAAKALRDGDCDLALAGGVSIEMPQGRGYLYRDNDILSPDGHCRAFDHKAAGTVMGSGVGVVVLRRLDEALADGDHIWAVIKGTGVNNDGGDKAGFFAPSETGQAEVVGQALDAAGVAPDSIAYVECHGTATLLGDPFEVAGLTRAWRARGAAGTQACGIGSVQTNLGNLDTAAAVAGLVKTALALHHAEIPPSLNYEAPNPMIDFAASPFHVADRRAAWPERDTPRRAAVNSLGIGGTNAHAVLEQAPECPASEPGLFPFQPIVLSARSAAALDAMSARLAAHLRAHPEESLADVAFTLIEGRKRFEKTRVLVAHDPAEAAQLLESGDRARVFTEDRLGTAPDAVFLFPARPQLAPAALRDLYDTEPVFRDALDRGLAALGALAGADIPALVFAADAQSEAAARRRADPALAEPLAVILGVAAAELALSWGVVPSALAGAAAGETAAAVVAGVLDLEAAVNLAHFHGRRAATTDPTARRVLGTELRTFARGLALQKPRLPLLSARTGAPLTAAQATSAETWLDTAPDDSRHAKALASLAARPDRAFLVLGPDPDLAARLRAAGIADDRIVDLLAPVESDLAGDVHFVAALARLHGLGIDVDWDQFWAGARRQRLPLPGTAFQRARYLIEPGTAPAAEAAPAGPPRQDAIADWGWRPAWLPAHAACEHDVAEGLDRAPKQTWLVFEDAGGLAAAAFDRLEAAGHTVVRVAAGDCFAEVGARRFTVMSEQGRAGYEALFAALAERGLLPTRIVHFWALAGATAHRPGSDPFHDNMEYGVFSLSYLAQALGGADLPGPVHVLAVTRGAVSVNGGALAEPETATIAGPAGAMAREVPGVTCATLDLDPEAGDPARRGLFARRDDRPGDVRILHLLEDLLAEPANEVAAWRGTRRYRQVYRKVALPAPEASVLRDGGTWLITGGLGDLGREIARGLIETHGARVLLVGRRALPPRESWPAVLRRSPPGDRTAAAIRGVQALEAAGGAVEIATADVTNLEAMRAVVAAATARHGRIDGVIHAAGIGDTGPLLERDAEAMKAVLAPKIDGLRVLDALFPDGATDLMVLFSSTAPAVHPAGAADLAAADAYLDAYAQSRQHGRTRVVSIGWGAWSEIGMAARALDPAVPTELPADPVDAPFLDSAGFDPDGARLMRTDWAGSRAWVFDQHSLGAGEGQQGPGTGLMPMSAILELAAEAYRADGGTGPFEIRDLALARPLLATEGLPKTTVRLHQDGATVQFELYSEHDRDGRPVRRAHARARIAASGTEPPPPVGFAAVAARCRNGRPRAAGEGDYLRTPQQARLGDGPAWQGLRESLLGETEGLARLKLPASAADTLAPGTLLHPGLLELAMTWAVDLAAAWTADSLWLPERCGTVRVHGPLGAELACWVRHTGADTTDTARFDVTLCDLHGQVLVEIEALQLRRSDPAELLAPSATEDVAATEPAPRGQRAANALHAWTVDNGIRPGEGFAALERALACDLPQVLVTPLDLAGLIAAADRAQPEAPRLGQEDGQSPGQGFDRPALATAYAAPETDTETALAADWSRLLGLAQVGIDDDFFELGGHSLIAARLCASVNARLGTDFRLAILAETPTIREWAARIDAAAAPADAAAPAAQERPDFTHIVPLNRAGDPQATPLFIVAGMFGNVLNLRHVAQILRDDRPVYGLQAKGLLGDDAPFDSFADAAASKLAEIRRIQPHGPYLLAGFSGGGITALEIARLIEEAGETVALVALFDTYRDLDSDLRLLDKALMKLTDFRRKGLGYGREWLRDRVAWELGKRRSRAPDTAGAFHNQRIEQAFRRAIAAYEPARYEMNCVLLRPALDKHYKVSRGRWISAEKRYVTPDNDWGAYIPRLEVVEVPGDHDSMVLVPNVGVLGAALRARIDTALAAPGETVQWERARAAE